MPTADEATQEQTVDETLTATEDETTSDTSDQSSDDSELKEKLAAAEQDAKRWKGRLKKLQSALSDEEEKPKKKADPKPVTEESLQEMETRLLWQIEKKGEISLAKEEYDKYVSEGYKKEDALRLAHLDKGITPSNMSEHLRQQASSSEDTSVDRKGGAPLTEIEGVSPSLIKSMKARGLKDEDIKRLAAKAKKVQEEAQFLSL